MHLAQALYRADPADAVGWFRTDGAATHDGQLGLVRTVEVARMVSEWKRS